MLQHRGDVAGDAAHRRGLQLRALGDRPVGRIHHRARGEHRVRRHPGGGRVLRRRVRAASCSNDLFDINISQPVWWAIFYVLFVGLNIVGIEATMRFSIVICLMALGDPRRLLRRCDPEVRSRPADEHPAGGRATPRSCRSASAASSRRCRTRSGSTSRSRSCRWPPRSRWIRSGTSRRERCCGLLTLVVCAFGVLFLNPGIPARRRGDRLRRGEPLLDGFRTIFGSSEKLAAVFGLLALAGLIASFHTIIFAYGRNIYSLSRAGYFPHWMSVTGGRRRTPVHRAAAGRRGRLRAGVGPLRVRLQRRGRRHDGRGGPAEHGGVRRRDLLRDADVLVHPAPPEDAERGAPVPQPDRCRGCGRSPASSRWSRWSPSTWTPRTARPCTGSPPGSVSGILYFAIVGRNR